MPIEAKSPQPVERQVFWGEIAPCEHMIQIYSGDEAIMDSLEGFVRGGLSAAEGVIVIATIPHLRLLEHRLRAPWQDHEGIDLAAARAANLYVTADAEALIGTFMTGGHIDEVRFEGIVDDLIRLARGDGRRVRAFGEMVAVLWTQGMDAATFQLERVWHRLCQEKTFSLFCAYPRSGLTQSGAASIQQLCDAHSRVIGD